MRIRAIVDGQLVDVTVIRERRFLLWNQSLVSYRVVYRDQGKFLYEATECKWVNSKNLLPDKDPQARAKGE